MEQYLVADLAALLRIRCNIEAMVSDNKRREINKMSLAYGELDFYGYAIEAGKIEDRLRRG